MASNAIGAFVCDGNLIENLIEALEAAREFLCLPMAEVRPSSGSANAWVDARQAALWTVEKALGLYPEHVQRVRDEWLEQYQGWGGRDEV